MHWLATDAALEFDLKRAIVTNPRTFDRPRTWHGSVGGLGQGAREFMLEWPVSGELDGRVA